MKTARLLAFALMIIFASSCVCAAAEKTAKAQWWGKAPGEKQAVRGTVADISAQSISVQTEKQGLKTFNITDKTKIMIRGQKAAISNISKGDHVIVRYKKKQDSLPFATAIIVPKPSVEGKIASISGNAITIKNKQNEFKIIVSKDTKFMCHDYEVSKNDLKAGARIVAFGSFGSNAFMPT